MLDYPIEDAAALLKLAGEDAGLTTADLAVLSGLPETRIVGIEAGSEIPDPTTLRALLTASQIRPAVPLGLHREKLRELAIGLGVESVDVFGSAARGLDDITSDVDLLIRVPETTSGFAVAGFQTEAQIILGFPVDIMLDDATGPVGDRARREAVAL